MTSTRPRPPTAVAAFGSPLGLDVAQPLSVHDLPGPMTLAVVSIGWLRGLDADRRRALVDRHLDRDEAQQESSFPVPKRRDEWLAGRLAVKHGVCGFRRHHDETLATRSIRVVPVPAGLCKGRPMVDHLAHVSLSHSGDFAVALAGPRPVGVDIERVRELAPPLVTLLRRDPAGDMPLLLRWACKEAVLKCLGVGLRVQSREVVLTAWRDDGTFAWRPGPVLRRRLPGPTSARHAGWAGTIDGYALAAAWRERLPG